MLETRTIIDVFFTLLYEVYKYYIFKILAVNTNDKQKITLSPKEKATLQMHYSPLQKGKASCDVKLTVVDNPFENFTVIKVLFFIFIIL